MIGACKQWHRATEFRNLLDRIEAAATSDLDMVEGRFPLLTRRRLQRGAVADTDALEAAIDAYMARTDDDPEPFVWTRSADAILAGVARFCQRTAASDHEDPGSRQVLVPGGKSVEVRQAEVADEGPLRSTPHPKPAVPPSPASAPRRVTAGADPITPRSEASILPDDGRFRPTLRVRSTTLHWPRRP